MSITSETLRLQAQLDAQLDKITDQQVRDLTAAWIRAWDETAGDLDTAVEMLLRDEQTGVVAKALVIRNRRLLGALDQIGRSLTTLARDAGVRIVGDIPGIVRTAASAQAPIIGSQLPESYDLTGTVAAHTLEAIVRRTATQITSETFPIASDAYDAMRRELLRGVVVGANPRHTATRIMDRAEQRFNGGLSRALNVASTESLDAHRAGSAAGQEPHADVLTGWTWLTHLDVRTCPSCIVMNGRVFPLSEPGPYDHQNGRCARAPKTVSWAELGIPGMDEEPADVVPDSRAWFDGLSEAEQVKILGRERLDLLNSGRIGWDDLAQLQQNPGWRPSYRVPSVRDLRVKAAAA